MTNSGAAPSHKVDDVKFARDMVDYTVAKMCAGLWNFNVFQQKRLKIL